MIKQSEWKWFGTPLHFICSHDCRFHLGTQVGEYVISTVGEYRPKDSKQMETLGYGDKRFYETMVFKADGKHEGCDCPDIEPSEIEVEYYQEHGQADKGHVALCLKYAEMQK